MRLLAAVRLSRLSDSTTSVDTQAENLEEYARRHGHTIVALTEDLDVSGGKPIRKRPGVRAPDIAAWLRGVAGLLIWSFVAFSCVPGLVSAPRFRNNR